MECDNKVKELDEYLRVSDIANADKLVKEPHFQQCFNDCCWELITAVSFHLNEDVLEKDLQLFDFCKDLINMVAEKCPAEEGLLQIIDQVESLNDVRFTSLLIPMQKTLLRIENKLGLSVEWCLNSIHRHLHSLPLPDEEGLEGEELKLLDANPCVQRIAELYVTTFPFYEPLVEKLSTNDSSTDVKTKEHLKDGVLCSFFRLLGKPLMFMDLEYDGKSKSNLRSVSEMIVDNIYKVNWNLISLLEMRNLSNILEDIRKSNEEFKRDTEPSDTFPAENRYSAVTLGVFSYLIFGERIKIETIPQVYNPLLILSKNLYLSAVLLKAPAVLIQRKGLLLLKGALDRFVDNAIPHTELESPTYRHLIEGLYVVAVYSNEKSNRQLSVKLIKDLLFKYDTSGRYILLVKMVKVANHSGIIGYLATLYKDVLMDILNRQNDSETEFYTQKRITYLLDAFCDLPHKGHSDLVELSDQIISSLNLIRFIVIKDKNDVTGIKHYVKQLEKGFFKHLLDGINLSRAHYKLKLEDAQNEKRKRKGVIAATRSTPIIIGKTPVPNLPTDEKIFIIKSALSGFDVMESLLCRVNECIDLYINTK